MPLWSIPAFYGLLSTVAGLIIPRLETHLFGSSYLLAISSVQAFLSATASGMMALTGIVFSIAFVMVQFNAIAYSPRLVMWFSRDRLIFHSIGMFVATFMFSLAVLGWIDRQNAPGVPLLSVIIVFLMLKASVVMLTFLIQRLKDLQVTNVLQALGEIGRKVIVDTYSVALGDPKRTETRSEDRSNTDCFAFQLTHAGAPRAILSIDLPSLALLASEMRGVIKMACQVGDVMLEGQVLLTATGLHDPPPRERFAACIKLGVERSFEQDPAYILRLLVDIAIKALSPAINDPTTATQAIDQIEDLLRRLAKCNLESNSIFDDTGAVRVVYRMPSWDDYLSLAFDEIRQFGVSSIQVMRRLHAALTELGELTDPDRAKSARAYLRHLNAEIAHSNFDKRDQAAARVNDRQGLGGATTV